MAETRNNQTAKTEDRGQALEPRERGSDVQRWAPSFGDPLEMFNRMSEEMDRTFERMWRDFGLSPRRSWLPRGLFGRRGQQGVWAPRVEAFQKGDRFIVRAELPGLKKDDVEVELTNDALTIRGERHEQRDEEREGYVHSEREYGGFYRAIPLPEGVIGESAEATFRDGLLEISMQAAPAETSRGRRVEITDASQAEQKK
jgi:HSP20 family protein